MAWIESHQTLWRHPKTQKAARLAGVNLHEMIGLLHCLWWWSLDYAEDGDLSRFDPDDIELSVGWTGEPGKLWRALIGVGFIDEGQNIHDWHEYAGKIIELRQKNNVRTKDMREAYRDGTIAAVRARDGDNCRYCGNPVEWEDRKGAKGGTYDHVIPDGPSILENMVVCCRGCNSRKGKRTPDQAGMPILPMTIKSKSSAALDLQQKLSGKSGANLLTKPNQPNQPTNPHAAQPENAPESPQAAAADLSDFALVEQAHGQFIGAKMGLAQAQTYEQWLKLTSPQAIIDALSEAARSANRNGGRYKYALAILNRQREDRTLPMPARPPEMDVIDLPPEMTAPMPWL